MRYVLLFTLIVQTAIIIGLLSIMNERFFSGHDMVIAYQHGCEFGRNSIHYQRIKCEDAIQTYLDVINPAQQE